MPNDLIELPVIPETITVHLGLPTDASAPNVTVPFIDYIKNVASSEIYPTWPEEAIRANIYAQISYALNRVYTEYYRGQGRDFDITNTTAFDQAFVNNRDIFENISRIVDDIFNVYIRRQDSVEPLFAQYCNGTTTTCAGLSQWGTVDLARNGLTPYEILQNYYGQDIQLEENAPIANVQESYPGRILMEGSSGNAVTELQIRLNRISRNYPAIPKINPVDGVYGAETEAAVREFQRVFNLAQTGQVAKDTWYRIISIYNAVKRLASIDSEGITVAEVSRLFPEYDISLSDTGDAVRVVQYYLSVLGRFINEIPNVVITGEFDAQTETAVRSFQEYTNLPVTGIVDRDTWNFISDYYLGTLRVLPPSLTGRGGKLYPGVALKIGSTGDDVATIQEYINLIAQSVEGIPTVAVDGDFGPATQAAVIALQERYGLTPNGIVGVNTWDAIIDEWSDLRFGYEDVDFQFPGYPISEIMTNL